MKFSIFSMAGIAAMAAAMTVWVLMAGIGPSPALAAPFECTASAEVAKLGTGLPNTARAIRRGDPLVIVTIGSSSTEGVGASATAFTYPARLARELRARWPALDIRVINRGIGGETAAEMVTRFKRDVLAYTPQLVIWQSGSNSVIRGVPVADYIMTVREGIESLKAAGTDIVLMNAQYAPVVIARPAHRRVLDATREVANDTKVGLFRRFAVMKEWVSSGRTRTEDVIARDRLHMNDASYGCIARLLAESIVAAARETPAKPAPSPARSPS